MGRRLELRSESGSPFRFWAQSGLQVSSFHVLWTTYMHVHAPAVHPQLPVSPPYYTGSVGTLVTMNENHVLGLGSQGEGAA